MNSLLRSVCISVVATLLASSATVEAQPTDERVLVVGVSKTKGSDGRLAKSLSEHLQHAGMMLTEGALSASDRACESLDCLEELAKREGAQMALTAKVQENAPNSFFITMALFDAARRAPFQETALCDQCNHEALVGKLSDLADKLVSQCREARQHPNSGNPTQAPYVPSVPLVPLPGTDPVQRPQVQQGFKLSPQRKILAGVLGGAAGAALITSIALAATNGNRTSLGCDLRTDVKSDYCELHNIPVFATGFALTGVLAVGLGFTLFWPEKSTTVSAPATSYSAGVR